jgi:hypothetical protein
MNSRIIELWENNKQNLKYYFANTNQSGIELLA